MGTKAIISTPVNELSFSKSYDDVADKEFKTISVNYDGYPENIYKKLREIIKQYDVQIIFAGGNIQSLQHKYEPNPLGYHSIDLPQSNVTTVYKRDLDNKDNVDLSKFEHKIIQLKDREEHYPFTDYVYTIYKNEIYCLNEEKLEFEVLDGK